MEDEDNHVKVAPAPVIFLIFIALGLILNWVLPLPSFTDVLAARVVGLLVIGLLIGYSAIVQMRKIRTSPNPHKPATALVQAGVFRYTRNPLYLSLFIMYIGIAIGVNAEPLS